MKVSSLLFSVPIFNDFLSVYGEEASTSRMLFHACKVCTIVSLTGFTLSKRHASKAAMQDDLKDDSKGPRLNVMHAKASAAALQVVQSLLRRVSNMQGTSTDNI